MTESAQHTAAYEDARAGSDDHAPLGQTGGYVHPPTTIPEDALKPGSPFPFGDPEVVKQFETNVIARQVPGYSDMRLRCLQIGHQFVQPDTDVLDIGTSQGKMIRDLVALAYERGSNDLIDTVTYLGIDVEDDMLAVARSVVDNLFAEIGRSEESAHRQVRLENVDLTDAFPHANPRRGYSLVTSILTLQFVPMEHRQRIVADIYNSLNPGGAFILVEKVIGNSAVVDRLLVDAYHDMKRRNGLSEEAIARKAKAISGFLVPQRSEENNYMLQQAGFSRFRIDTFWRDLQFEAVIAIK